MLVTREEMIKRLSAQSGFFQKDIRTVLQCLDDVVFDALNEATLEDEVQIQMTTGIKLGCKIVGERQRVDPRTQQPHRLSARLFRRCRYILQYPLQS